MLLFPFMGLGLIKMHIIRDAWRTDGKRCRPCRGCIYNDHRGYSNDRPCGMSSYSEEENGEKRECK